MNVIEYQDKIREFAIYPDALQRTLPELMYLALGLSNEAGEVAGKIKKLYRDTTITGVDDISEEKQLTILAEMSDVLWYLTRLADTLDADVPDLAAFNYEKLADRAERNVLGGDGDSR